MKLKMVLFSVGFFLKQLFLEKVVFIFLNHILTETFPLNLKLLLEATPDSLI